MVMRTLLPGDVHTVLARMFIRLPQGRSEAAPGAERASIGRSARRLRPPLRVGDSALCKHQARAQAVRWAEVTS
jgi:hypothetical protein